jgi:hypothetical protein
VINPEDKFHKGLEQWKQEDPEGFLKFLLSRSDKKPTKP